MAENRHVLLLPLTFSNSQSRLRSPTGHPFPTRNMALPTQNHQLCLLFALVSSLFLLTTGVSGLNLDQSDLRAFNIISNGLGISCHGSPCSHPGVFCERRLSGDDAYVLRITRLVFKSQGLSGSLSPMIGRLTELRELNLPNNQIVGQVPSRIVDCKKLEVLDLGNNRLSGEVTLELHSLFCLRVLDLSSNKLSGNLRFLKNFPNLEKLLLANNLFNGRVPKSIRSFRNLKHFDFSGNSFLEGPIPIMNEDEEFVGSQYPKRYILAENSTTASKNSSSAAAPVSSASNTTTNGTTAAEGPTTSAASTKKHKDRKTKLRSRLIGFFSGIFAGTISGFIFALVFKIIMAVTRGGRKDSGPAIFSPLIKKAEYLAFLEKEDGVASLEIIGRGGCGEVYKAPLVGSEDKMLAIKKINQPPKDATELAEEHSKDLNKKMRQIRSEINTVGHIRHRNLLPLLAHVAQPNCHYLVYEYMKNGSLQDILTEVSEGRRELDWLARHRIALGIAAGLEYLHTSHNPRIIHRDLKPANVLLDDDMEARISDFGLAKAMPDAYTHVTTSNVAGTIGYIAPEYHQTLKFTDKCDIYSFGVVLGVLVIGKQPSDVFFQDTNELSMVKWMRNIMTSDNPSQAIDPRLMDNGFEEQMLLVLKIACFCTMEDPKQRPNSKNVRLMLSQIKH